MFVPFLPIIIAAITLGFLPETSIFQDSGSTISPWVTILSFLVISTLLAQNRVTFKEQPRFRFSLNRLIIFCFWFLLISWNHSLNQLTISFTPFIFNEELSFAIILTTYWFGDALVQNPIYEWKTKALIKKIHQTLFNLRLQLPILILMFLQFWLNYTLEHFLDFLLWGKIIILTLSSLLLMILSSPYLMVVCWGAQPLASDEAESLIQNELDANQTSVRRILSWPDHIVLTATAGVIGFIPGFRYLLISNSLIKALSPQELRAVIAHEAGHIKRHHMFFFLLSFLSFLVLLFLGFSVIDIFHWIFAWEFSLNLFFGVLSVLAFIIFFRFFLGFLSRNFERQADCNSLERSGLNPFRQALLKVGWLNSIDPEEDNWHHYGIQQRINFLTMCYETPQRIVEHHQLVRKIKFISIGFLIILFGLSGIFTSTDARFQLLTYGASQQLQKLDQDNPLRLDRIHLLTEIAIQYQLKNEITKAEPIYRELLKIVPQNATVLNNLAWLLVTSYEKDIEKAKEALAFVQLALEQEKSAYIWDTLAETYSKLGNKPKATEAALKALELAKKGEGTSQECDLECYEQRLIHFQQL